MDKGRSNSSSSRLEFNKVVLERLNESFIYWYTPLGSSSTIEKPYFDKNQTLELLEIAEECDENIHR